MLRRILLLEMGPGSAAHHGVLLRPGYAQGASVPLTNHQQNQPVMVNALLSVVVYFVLQMTSRHRFSSVV
ncbi:MAG: hypothetical protein JHD07_14110 [Bradyrhizobium sp.]|uniref:hypothetical protein n=1 Tax=Bradyrhizobium sp. TaxID=376 RepID=UPI001A2075FA|nr:hypothetical protein [Bradyrhizobium sp.]MBJ7404358.1 hypothetical protein [Bradyrhizobium sp.]